MHDPHSERMSSGETRAASGLALVFAFRMLGMFMVLPVLATYGMELHDATPALIGLAIGQPPRQFLIVAHEDARHPRHARPGNLKVGCHQVRLVPLERPAIERVRVENQQRLACLRMRRGHGPCIA